ncbi:hypothetical protein PVAND_009088 [Polypedilum vanderplanki]|nr:hypothetical protein PVAND_009088 [Polypedilum vanderplanki]
MTETGVRFTDGSLEECSLIVYATGYLYSYPYLSIDSGVTCNGDYVRPLWMHCLSINKPTLGFIGLPNLICPNQMFQLQVEFCLTFMTKRKKLPSKEQMLEEYELDMLERWKKGLSKRKGHFLGHKAEAQKKYYDELAKKANIEGIKSCIVKIHSHAHLNRSKHFTNYRNVKYTIIDENNFIVSPLQ